MKRPSLTIMFPVCQACKRSVPHRTFFGLAISGTHRKKILTQLFMNPLDNSPVLLQFCCFFFMSAIFLATSLWFFSRSINCDTWLSENLTLAVCNSMQKPCF